MLYRRKVIMAILQLWGKLNATDVQKMLFLFAENQESGCRIYDFVPYHFGSFSFVSYADKRAMVASGMIATAAGLGKKEIWDSNDRGDYFSSLTNIDQVLLKQLHDKFKNIRGKKLLRYVYKKYPYYAIKSEVAETVLSQDELKVVEKFRPHAEDYALFTIGYEGISFDGYLNTLIKKNIHLLCDVRKNPISMKYGFSKKTLQSTLAQLDIEYVHMPELGIVSEKRKHLETEDDYIALFKEYEQSVLPEQEAALLKIKGLIGEKRRLALTCFEARPSFCHRHKVAEALLALPNWQYTIEHL